MRRLAIRRSPIPSSTGWSIMLITSSCEGNRCDAGGPPKLTRRLHDHRSSPRLSSVGRGQGTQTPPLAHHPVADRLTPLRAFSDDGYSPASLRSDGDRHRWNTHCLVKSRPDGRNYMLKLNDFRLHEGLPSIDTRSYLAEEIVTGKTVMVHIIPTEEPIRSRLKAMALQLVHQQASTGVSQSVLVPEDGEFVVSSVIPGFSGLRPWLESQLSPPPNRFSQPPSIAQNTPPSSPLDDELLDMLQSYVSKKGPDRTKPPKELAQTRIGLKGFDPPEVTASTFGKPFTPPPPPPPPAPSGPSFDMVISGIRPAPGPKPPELRHPPSIETKPGDPLHAQLVFWKRASLGLIVLVVCLAIALAFMTGRAIR